MFQQEGLDMFRNTAIEAALAIATFIPSFALAKTVTLNPDEASNKDTFDYAFKIPDTLGIPGSTNRLNFDTEDIPGTAAVPFGATLGVAETTPFRNNPLDPPSTAAPIQVNLRPVLEAWDWQTVTWDT